MSAIECVCGRSGCESCHETRVLDEATAREAKIVTESSYPIECKLCGIELGEGHHKCRRAVGSDICLDCAIIYDSPTSEEVENELETRFEKRESNMNGDDAPHGVDRGILREAGRLRPWD